MNERASERRARRLVALDPKGWRDRFGDEFEQLLIDEMHERPHSHRRTGDVAAHALWARLVEAGVAGRGFAPRLQAWIALRVLVVVSAVFVVMGTGMWSQVTVGWQWSAPSAPTTRVGMLMMSGALLGLAALVVLALLPGQHTLDELDGACSVAVPKETFATTGPTVTGRYFSHARNRDVGYAIAYPPDHRAGDRLPLGLYLYPDGGDHTSPLGRLAPARVLAGNGIAPIALVTCDGGRDLYWNPHPGDDPMGMLVDEVLPMCQRRGLGTTRGGVGAIGVSMGGYGAILLAEKHPARIAAVAAISPAIWTSYGQAAHVNPAAYASAQDFARDDVITHADALTRIPVRIASGADDPFHDGVLQLIRRLGTHATVDLSGGCHDTSFFASQQQRSLQFLAQHITT